MFYDADGIERDPNLSKQFWDIITDQDFHWLFMMGLLGEKMEGRVSVQSEFGWESPEYGDNSNHSVKVYDHEVEMDWDFPDPPEFLR